MIEHTYFVCKSSWCINIKIIAGHTNFDNKFFYDDELPYLVKGLEIVQKKIVERSIYKDTLIIIDNLQYSVCDFQEEGLTVAIIEWASKAFDFSKPVIEVDFQKKNNRYVFNFE